MKYQSHHTNTIFFFLFFDYWSGGGQKYIISFRHLQMSTVYWTVTQDTQKLHHLQKLEGLEVCNRLVQVFLRILQKSCFNNSTFIKNQLEGTNYLLHIKLIQNKKFAVADITCVFWSTMSVEEQQQYLTLLFLEGVYCIVSKYY